VPYLAIHSPFFLIFLKFSNGMLYFRAKLKNMHVLMYMYVHMSICF